MSLQHNPLTTKEIEQLHKLCHGQEAATLHMLVDAFPCWIPCFEFPRVGILQYTRAIFNNRKALVAAGGNFQITNRTEIIDGKKHGSYRLERVQQTFTPITNGSDLFHQTEAVLRQSAVPLFATAVQQ